MTIKDYRNAIANATTAKELMEISYKAFLQDENALSGKRTLYDKVVTMCIQREAQLDRGNQYVQV